MDEETYDMRCELIEQKHKKLEDFLAKKGITMNHEGTYTLPENSRIFVWVANSRLVLPCEKIHTMNMMLDFWNKGTYICFEIHDVDKIGIAKGISNSVFPVENYDDVKLS